MRLKQNRIILNSPIREIVVVGVFFIFLFYMLFSSGVKLRIEGFLLYSRTFFPTFIKEETKSSVIGIGLKSDSDFSKNPQINYTQFIESIKKIEALSPKLVVVLIPPPYDQRTEDLISTIKLYPNIIIGVYGVYFTSDLRYLPRILRPLSFRIYNAECSPTYNPNPIWSFPLLDYGFDIYEYSDQFDFSLNDTLDNNSWDENEDRFQSEIVTDIGVLEDREFRFKSGRRRYKNILPGIIQRVSPELINRIQKDLVPYRIASSFSENILLHYRKKKKKKSNRNNNFIQSIDDFINQKSTKDQFLGKVVILGVDSLFKYRDQGEVFYNSYLRVPFYTDFSDDNIESKFKLTTLAVSNALDQTYLRVYKNPYVYITMIVLSLLFNLLLWKKIQFVGSLILFALMQILVLFVGSVILQKYNYIILMSDFIIVSFVSFIFLFSSKFKDSLTQNMYWKEKLKKDTKLELEYDKFLDSVVESIRKFSSNLHKQLCTIGIVEDDSIRLKMLETTTNLNSYLSNLISINQAYKSKLNITMSEFDVVDLVLETLQEFRQAASEKNILLDSSKVESILVKSDFQILKQILSNLISNAIKYAYSDTTVSIYTKTNRKKVILYVSDYGLEVNPENYKFVFEKFYRVKDDNVRNTEGFGMGLYLSRYFSKKIGSKIDIVKSNEKNKVEFYVDVNRVESKDKNKDKTDKKKNKDENINISKK